MCRINERNLFSFFHLFSTPKHVMYLCLKYISTLKVSLGPQHVMYLCLKYISTLKVSLGPQHVMYLCLKYISTLKVSLGPQQFDSSKFNCIYISQNIILVHILLLEQGFFKLDNLCPVIYLNE